MSDLKLTEAGKVKLFDEEGKLDITVAKAANDIRNILFDVIKVVIGDKIYLIKQDKTSIKGLEEGVDRCFGTQNFILPGDKEPTPYFHVIKKYVDVEPFGPDIEGDVNAHHFINKEGVSYPGLERGFEVDESIPKKIQRFSDKKYNIIGNGNFVFKDWADYFSVHDAGGMSGKILIAEFENGKKGFVFIWKGEVGGFTTEKYDSIEVHNGQNNDGKPWIADKEGNATISLHMKQKFDLYNQRNEKLTKHSLDNNNGELMSYDFEHEVAKFSKFGHFSLYYAPLNKVIWKKDGAKEYKTLRNGKYFVMTEDKKTIIYTHNANQLFPTFPQGFDHFIGSKQGVGTLFVMMENDGKYYLLETDGGQQTSHILADGFDSVTPMFEQYHRNHTVGWTQFTTNQMILLKDKKIPFIVNKDNKQYLFDHTFRALSRDHVDSYEEITPDGVISIKQGNKYYFINFSPAVTDSSTWKKNAFDKIVDDSDKKCIIVENDGKHYKYHTGLDEMTEIKEEMKQEDKNELELNNFFDNIPAF